MEDHQMYYHISDMQKTFEKHIRQVLGMALNL